MNLPFNYIKYLVENTMNPKENSPYFLSCSCRFSCLVKALAAINTLAGISQPPPNTPYPFLGSGCIKYSNTSSSSFSTQYMQFTGHDSTETYKNETKTALFGVLLSFISTDLLSFSLIYLNFLIVVSILNLYSCTAKSIIHGECITCIMYTFPAPCEKLCR